MRLRVVFLCIALTTIGSCALAQETPETHPINPAELAQALGRATKVVVYDGTPTISIDGKTPSPLILYSSDRMTDVSELKAAAHVQTPKEWMMCACASVVDVSLFAEEQEVGFFSVYLLGEPLIRFAGWNGDAPLADQEKLLKWFDSRGISVIREAIFEEARGLAASEDASVRWVNAMPEPARPRWPKAAAELHDISIESFEKAADLLQPAFERAFPDRDSRIRALFTWFGSGDGPWTGYPAYEDVAARLLLRFEPAQLVAALKDGPLTPAQLEGAGRFLAGYNYGFRFKEPDDHKLIDRFPRELQRALLQHALRSTDPDKVSRARKAFDQPKP